MRTRTPIKCDAPTPGLIWLAGRFDRLHIWKPALSCGGGCPHVRSKSWCYARLYHETTGCKYTPSLECRFLPGLRGNK